MKIDDTYNLAGTLDSYEVAEIDARDLFQFVPMMPTSEDDQEPQATHALAA